MRTKLFAAILAFSLASTGTALADSGANIVPNGYAFPDYWGTVPAQQLPNPIARDHIPGSSVSPYATQPTPASNGTYLFPPNPWQ
jgi:hypothetical protein